MKLKLHTLIISLLLLTGFGVASTLEAAPAQTKTKVSGIIKDAAGEPIPGANILLKDDTTVGVMSETDGTFSINVPKGAVLVVSFLGYETQEVEVGTRAYIEVVLRDSKEFLDEVVVIGYGTMKKGDITSAVVSVKPEDFNLGNIQDAAELVRGKVAGLNITKGSGNPLSSSTIRLRGVTTIYGDLTPLILVDGIPGDMNTVAPENIASIDVLKDASAAAIYGTRGANGVILITTKGGQYNEKLKVNYSGYASAAMFYNKADFYDAADIKASPTVTAFKNELWSTDWIDEISRVAISQNHSITLEGGGQSSSYLASIAYRNDQGVIRNTDNEQLRMQFDVTQFALKGILKFNLNAVLGNQKYKNVNSNYAYRQAVIRNPTSPVYLENANEEQDPTLGYYEEFNRFQYYNPVSILNEQIGDTRYQWSKLTGNITVEPIKGWQTNLMLSTDRSTSVSQNYYTSKYYSLAPAGTVGSASKSEGDSQSDYLELTSKYERTVNKHRVSAIVGYSYNIDTYSGFNASNSNFPTESYLYNNLGVGKFDEAIKNSEGTITGIKRWAGLGSYKSESKLIGFFGRVSYGYDNRYNVLISFRREGSTKFGAGRHWGDFPSASFGWTISNEEWMAGTKGWLNNLKVRLGYGKTGIIPGSSYMSLTTYDYDSSYGNFLNASGVWTAGLVSTQNDNKMLQWETTSEHNIGVDFGFFNDRISGSIDLYNKKTSDLLFSYTVPCPPNLYTSTTANAAEVRNQGIELLLKGIPIQTRDFQWISQITVSHNKSKLLSLSNELYETESYYNDGGVGDPVSVSTHRVEEGMPFGNFWMLKSIGVSEKGKWVIENPKAVTLTDGQWYDADGNAVDKYKPYTTDMNSDDWRQYMGNGLPQVYLNWGNTFTYKGFDLGVQLSSQLGFKILNSQRVFYENNSIAYNRLRSAGEAKPVVDLTTGEFTGEYVKLSTSQQQCVVSDYLEDGDYLKLDNVTLGYTFNFQNKANEYIKSVRAYLSGENIVCLTKYSGLDPELSNSYPFAAGLDDRDKYPTIRSFTFGISVTF